MRATCPAYLRFLDVVVLLNEGKFVAAHSMKGYSVREWGRVSIQSTSALDGGEGSTSRFGCPTPEGAPVPVE
jgi:hypothetical protein